MFRRSTCRLHNALNAIAAQSKSRAAQKGERASCPPSRLVVRPHNDCSLGPDRIIPPTSVRIKLATRPHRNSQSMPAAVAVSVCNRACIADPKSALSMGSTYGAFGSASAPRDVCSQYGVLTRKHRDDYRRKTSDHTFRASCLPCSPRLVRPASSGDRKFPPRMFNPTDLMSRLVL